MSSGELEVQLGNILISIAVMWFIISIGFSIYLCGYNHAMDKSEVEKNDLNCDLMEWMRRDSSHQREAGLFQTYFLKLRALITQHDIHGAAPEVRLMTDASRMLWDEFMAEYRELELVRQ